MRTNLFKTRWMLVGGAATLLACAHAKTVDEGKDTVGSSDKAKSQTKNGDEPAVAKASRPVKGLPPIAESPVALRKPGGKKKLEDALRQKGFLKEEGDASETQLSGALKKFQEQQNIAATGFADHETLKRLHLDPKQIDMTHDVGTGGAGDSGTSKK